VWVLTKRKPDTRVVLFGGLHVGTDRNCLWGMAGRIPRAVPNDLLERCTWLRGSSRCSG